VRKGVLGEVQVGEVSAAASQQGPKQLAERQRERQRGRETVMNELRCVHKAQCERVA